jgi:hypothetical protein
MVCLSFVVAAQINLPMAGTSFTQNFNNIGTDSLPGGFTVRAGATATAIGTEQPFTTTGTSWSSTTGRFANFAAGVIAANSDATQQATVTDRALGVRQTGSFGDPGAAFVLQIMNTKNRTGFALDLELQSLDASNGPRITHWVIDYGLGSNPTGFTPATATGTLTTGGNNFTTNKIHVDFGTALNNQQGIVTIRVVALTESESTGNRGTAAIDDFTLSWTNGDPTAPNMTIDPGSLIWPPTEAGTIPAIKTFNLYGVNLTNDIHLTVGSPWSISLDNINYSNSLMVAPTDPALVSGKTIYVKYAPPGAADWSSFVSITSVGAATRGVIVAGPGVTYMHLLTSPYTETFDGIGSGLPNGVSVKRIAAWNAMGQSGIYSTTPNDWNNSGTNFHNYASADIGEGAPQSTATDRALGVWQTASDGDPGAAFVFQLANTIGKADLAMDFKLQSLNASSQRITNWRIDYGFGATPTSFTIPPSTGSLATGGSTFSNNNIHVDFGPWLDNKSDVVTIRLIAVDPSTGTGDRPVTAIDDLVISWKDSTVDQSNLLSVSPLLLNFGEVAPGSHSAGKAVTVKSAANTDITLSVKPGYELSADNVRFSNTPLVIDQATAAAGTTVYIRFAPVSKSVSVPDSLHISGDGLNKNTVALSGSSYLKAETFDVACYNLAFFGSNATNNATPEKITTQIDNIASVLDTLHMDVIGVEEVSSDSAFNVLMTKLRGYSSILSNRWSYSFQPPDPDFPPQKTGFIYNTSTMTLSTAEPPRVLFAEMYDSVLAGTSTRVSTHFWASGRLPFMATFNVNVNGQMKKVRLIVIHAKAGSEPDDYSRRLFDAQVLKDTLDAVYRNDNVIILGDYNDRLYGSIFTGATVSPYNAFETDNTGYTPLTYSPDSAGKVSFIGGSALIDHIIITQPLRPGYIDNSTAIEDARLYISDYNEHTASDHLPVYTRFSFAVGAPLPVTLLNFNAKAKANTVLVSWITTGEQNNRYFTVERSGDGRHFTPIGRVAGAGNSNSELNYQFTDMNPLPGAGYYRLRQVDQDGNASLSSVATVRMNNDARIALTLTPNPVTSYVHININTTGKSYTMRVRAVDGRVLISGSGAVNQLNQQLNSRLNDLLPGVYVLTADNSAEHYTIKFMKQ